MGNIDTPQGRTDMTKIIINTVVTAGGIVAIFYAFGFAIVQSFVSQIEIEGMFLFTKDYYQEAGGKFVLEMLRAPLMNPFLFIAYLILLLILIPKEKNMYEDITSEGTLREKFSKLKKFKKFQKEKVILLLFIVFFTYMFEAIFRTFTDFVKAHFFKIDIFGLNVGISQLTNIMPVYYLYDHVSSEKIDSIVFFTLTVPVVIAISIFLYRFHKHRRSNSREYFAVLGLYVIFLLMLPISYGVYIYDMKAVPINNPNNMFKQTDTESYIKNTSQMFLLGHFEGKYVFLCVKNLVSDTAIPLDNVSVGDISGVVIALDEDRIKHINFSLTRTNSLRPFVTKQSMTTFKIEASGMVDNTIEEEIPLEPEGGGV